MYALAFPMHLFHIESIPEGVYSNSNHTSAFIDILIFKQQTKNMTMVISEHLRHVPPDHKGKEEAWS